MANGEERSEDLNPRSKDVDEKIRRLLDPSVPDEEPVALSPKKTGAELKIKQVDTKEPIAGVVSEEPASPTVILPPKKSRRVITPIDHEDSPDGLEDTLEPEEKPIVKISISHDNETKEELAEELDTAIANLEKEEPKAETSEDDEDYKEEPTAPKLESVPEDNAEEKEESKPEEKTPTSETPIKLAEAEEPEKPLPKPKVVEDEATDKAVKDIVSKESDELLEIEDAIRGADDEEEPKLKKQFALKKLLLNKKALKLYIVITIIGMIGAGLYPVSRYMLLSLAGVRSTSTLTVLDASNQQPLKNVTVSLGGVSVKTDSDGTAKLEHLKLGKTKMKIERVAFALVEKDIIVGWGSNPLGNFDLTPTGAQYKFEITDILSGKPITGVEAETTEATARSDDKGIIVLTLPKTEQAEVDVTIKAGSYRQETFKLNITTKETTKIQLAPAKKHTFISKRSGKFDIYSIYADAKEEKLVLAGSGNEREDMSLLPHPNKDIVAYVSTRAGKLSKDGFLMNDLVLVNVIDGKTTHITSIEKIQLVGWAEDRLVFVAIASGPSAASAQRNRLLSYNTEDNKTTELATSNYFNNLLLAKGIVYFAPSSAYAGGTPAQFYQVKADGTAQKSLMAQEVWNIVRTNYDHLALSVGQQWFDYALGASQTKKLDAAPAIKTGRVYVDSPDGKKSAWVDQRDGKGTLIIYDSSNGKDMVLTARTGLALPLLWLDNQTVVFRVDTKTEIADYAISLNGGGARKIRDVTKTSGLDNWYYY